MIFAYTAKFRSDIDSNTLPFLTPTKLERLVNVIYLLQFLNKPAELLGFPVYCSGWIIDFYLRKFCVFYTLMYYYCSHFLTIISSLTSQIHKK